jgi:hypothetical protein
MTNIDQLGLFIETTNVNSENHINTMCGKKLSTFNVKAVTNMLYKFKS